MGDVMLLAKCRNGTTGEIKLCEVTKLLDIDGEELDYTKDLDLDLVTSFVIKWDENSWVAIVVTPNESIKDYLAKAH